MARPIWTGSVAFGLVSVPVSLYTATEDKTVHFNQFQAGTSDRIRYKLVNERTGREVDLADIVRGYEVSKGDYVVVTDEELEAVDPGQSRTIDIADFVDLAEIDPIYFQKAYYLKQHLATIRAGEADVLALETMFFADEVRDPRDRDRGPPSVVDLGDALRRSLEAQKRRPPGGSSTGRGKAASKTKAAPSARQADGGNPSPPGSFVTLDTNAQQAVLHLDGPVRGAVRPVMDGNPVVLGHRGRGGCRGRRGDPADCRDHRQRRGRGQQTPLTRLPLHFHPCV